MVAGDWCDYVEKKLSKKVPVGFLWELAKPIGSFDDGLAGRFDKKGLWEAPFAALEIRGLDRACPFVSREKSLA